MKNSWRQNWVIFSSAHGDTGDKIWTLLKNENCRVEEWFINSTTRSILNAMGLDTTQSHVFRGSMYVGTLKDVPLAIDILKQQADREDRQPIYPAEWQLELPLDK